MKNNSIKTFIKISLAIATSMLLYAGYVFAFTENYNVYEPNTAINQTYNDDKILFIVDFSNSMNEYLSGSKKIDLAVHTLSHIVSRLNPSISTGLRVYGHKMGYNQILGCRASDLVLPVLPNNTQYFYPNLARMNASGWTPITYSLKQAVANDFNGLNGRKRIILLTDGGENCDESPCDYAINLVSQRDDIKIDVIAFAIDDEEADKQLKCTALATSGKFYKANDAESLMNSLENILDVQTSVEGNIIRKK